MEGKTLQEQVSLLHTTVLDSYFLVFRKTNVFISKIIHSLSNSKIYTLKSSFSEKNKVFMIDLVLEKNHFKYQANIL